MRPVASRAAALPFIVLALSLAAPSRSGAQPAAQPAPAAPAAPAQPSSSPEDLARHHHERGTVYYNLGQFEEAIAEYRKGYEQKAHPVFLFNIAQAYGQLGVHDKALFFYRRYLSTSPDAPNRGLVEERIAEFERALAGDGRARPAAPESLAAPSPSPLEGPAAVRDLSAPAPARAAAAPRPLWRRWWFWGAVGGAVLGGLAVGIAAASSGGPDTPGTELGSARFF